MHTSFFTKDRVLGISIGGSVTILPDFPQITTVDPLVLSSDPDVFESFLSL